MEGVKKALQFGNNTAITTEAFVDMVEWLAEEAEEDIEGVEEGGLAIPFDRHGAEILYVPNPREYTSNPQMFQTYLKFFFYAGVDWTLSSKFFDITNWAYYLGDTKAATTLVKNLVEETRRLGAKILLSTECGHGFKILRNDAERWLGEPLGFEVMSVVELAHQLNEAGRLPINPGAIQAKSHVSRPVQCRPQIGNLRASARADPGRSYGFRRTVAEPQVQHLLRRGRQRRPEHRYGQEAAGARADETRPDHEHGGRDHCHVLSELLKSARRSPG